jgi:type I restriction enzyme R subunit
MHLMMVKRQTKLRKFIGQIALNRWPKKLDHYSLDQEKVQKLISSYIFTEKLPYRDDVVDTMHKKPTILKRKTVSQRVLDKMLDYIKTFIDGVPE